MFFDSTAAESYRKAMVFQQMLKGFDLDIMDQEMIERMRELTVIYQEKK